MADSNPPLRVWAAAGVLTAALMLTLASIDVGSWFTHVRLAAQDDRMNLKRLERRPASAASVVAIGSSKTYFAMDYDDALWQRVLANDPEPAFTRLVWLDARFRDVEPALARMVQQPPTVLLIESDLLTIDRDGRLPIRDNLLQIGRYFHWLALRATGWTQAADDDLEANLGHDSFLPEKECLTRTAPAALAQYAASASDWRRASTEKRERYLVFLRRIARAGTRVVLLELPRSEAAESVFPRALEQDIQTVLATMSHDEGFERWQPPTPSDGSYCDQGHVNADGRAQISTWLAQKLVGVTGAPHG